MEKTVYLDSAASTKIAPQAQEAMVLYSAEKYGNASSVHVLGEEARKAEQQAKQIIARTIGADPQEIIFTSGGTESNNFALKAIAFANKDKGNHIITTKIEHSCIINACKWLEKQGFEVTYLPTDKQGNVSLKDLEKSIKPTTILVSIIHGHNEIGTIQPVEAIGKIIEKQKLKTGSHAYFHTDACQSFTKTELDVQKFKLDLASLNAHKLHGPKGAGALYIKKGTNIEPLHHGGEQQQGLRAGTENIPGIAGFAKAVEVASSKEHIEYMQTLKKLFLQKIKEIPKIKINSPETGGLPHIINVSFQGIEGEALVGYLGMEGVCASTGSACSSQKLEPSSSLLSIGLSPEEANGAVRFSLSRLNTKEEIDLAVEAVKKSVKKLREISPF